MYSINEHRYEDSSDSRGNSGMGKATAHHLAQKGYRVIIHGRNEQKTSEALNEIKTRSGNSDIESIAADISSVAGMKISGRHPAQNRGGGYTRTLHRCHRAQIERGNLP